MATFRPPPLTCDTSDAANLDRAGEDALPTDPDGGGQLQQAATATSSIFERSALLSNFLGAKSIVKYGAQDSSVGRFSAIHSIATAHDFGHLSALALASESLPFKTDAKFLDGQFHSGPFGRTDGAKPCDAASSSSAYFYSCTLTCLY